MTRASAEGQSPPETMRRLMHAILEHQEGELQDDATTMLVEWNGNQRRAHPAAGLTAPGTGLVRSHAGAVGGPRCPAPPHLT